MIKITRKVVLKMCYFGNFLFNLANNLHVASDNTLNFILLKPTDFFFKNLDKTRS